LTAPVICKWRTVGIIKFFVAFIYRNSFGNGNVVSGLEMAIENAIIISGIPTVDAITNLKKKFLSTLNQIIFQLTSEWYFGLISYVNIGSCQLKSI